jgi:hypothetical protein
MVDPSLLHTFNIDVLTDRRRYTGTFTTKKLSIRDLTQLGVRKVQLNGGLHYDATNPGKGIDYATDELNSMVAHMGLAITTAPDWWNLDDLVDLSVLVTVYDEVISFENTFLRRRETPEGDGSRGSSQGDSAQEDAQANPAGSDSAVVGEQVQAALEP